jgi:DNA invertase Pin-like site-specific DNA recombinase
MPRTTPDVLAIVREYVSGDTQRVVAARHHVNIGVVRSILREMGIPPRKTGQPPLPITPEAVKSVYEITGSQRSAAEALNISRTTVRSRLSQIGLCADPKPRQKDTEQ